MAGLLFALAEEPGWATHQVQRLVPSMLHYPWLRACRHDDAHFALALVLPAWIAPTLWHTTADGLFLAIFGEYYPERGPATDHVAWASGLAEAYRHGNGTALHNGNGLYNLVLWDRRRRRLVVANDATGALLLFRSAAGAGRVWCSEPGLLPRSGAIDAAALISLLRIGYQADHRTLHRGVEVLPPGTTEAYSFGTAGLVHRSESSLPAFSTQRAPFAEAFPTVFLDAVRVRLSGQQSVALPLSGGEDSRLLLGAALRLGCTVAAVTLDGCQRSDVSAAARVAQTVGIEHRVLRLSEHAVVDHQRLLRSALATTSDWHAAIFLAVFAAGRPGATMLLGFLGGTLAGAGVHPAGPDAGLAELYRQASAPFSSTGMTVAGREDLVGWPSPSPDNGAAVAELVVNLHGRQRRYISHLVRLAWNFGKPVCPFADVRLVRLALEARRDELVNQAARRRAFCRMFPQLAALPNGNDGLPLSSSYRRSWRRLLKQSGLGRLARHLLPGWQRRFDYGRLAPVAEHALQLVSASRCLGDLKMLPPLLMLAWIPLLLLEEEEAVHRALATGAPGTRGRIHD